MLRLIKFKISGQVGLSCTTNQFKKTSNIKLIKLALNELMDSLYLRLHLTSLGNCACMDNFEGTYGKEHFEHQVQIDICNCY